MKERKVSEEEERDGMEVEDLNEVEGGFSLLSSLCIYRTPLAMLRE